MHNVRKQAKSPVTVTTKPRCKTPATMRNTFRNQKNANIRMIQGGYNSILKIGRQSEPRVLKLAFARRENGEQSLKKAEGRATTSKIRK